MLAPMLMHELLDVCGTYAPQCGLQLESSGKRMEVGLTRSK